VLFGAVFLASACGDLPTTAEQAEVLPGARHSVVDRPGNGTVEVACFTSVATPGGPHAYEYGVVMLKLPASARSADPRLREYRYRGYANGAELIRAANCMIPNSEKAVEHMHRVFRVSAKAQEAARSGGAQLMNTGDQPPPGTLPTLEVNACPYGDPGAYPECSPYEPMDLPVDEQECTVWTGCGGTYTPTGGGGTPVPPEGPIIGAAVCLIGAYTTGLTINEAADGYSAALKAQSAMQMAQRTFDMYRQQSSDMQDHTMYYYLERDLAAKQQAYRDSISALASKMNIGAGAAVTLIFACATAILAPIP
jgi:hypothetical protein